jgi:hypothetical protein
LNRYTDPDPFALRRRRGTDQRLDLTRGYKPITTAAQSTSMGARPSQYANATAPVSRMRDLDPPVLRHQGRASTFLRRLTFASRFD